MVVLFSTMLVQIPLGAMISLLRGKILVPIELINSCVLVKDKIDFSKIKANMREWHKANIVVIGDAILDQYTACEALGMSAEAPVLVVGN